MKIAVAFLGMIAFAVVVSFLLAWPAMWLWNNVLIDVFPMINSIGWVDMWGLMILTQLLFGTAVKND
jgi:hypothetical protein